jgi:hypothetical protein
MGLLIYNTNDPVGLGINISGRAADAWKLYKDTYEVASEIAIINADCDLRNILYADGEDFREFITGMRTKWADTTALGAPINDKTFRTIILSALPSSWDPIVSTLYTTQTSHDAINQLMTHWARISRDWPTNPHTSTSALLAVTNKFGKNRQHSQLICTNPNCKHTGHTIEDCYWPGSGKPGQFPPSFGKHGGTRGTTNPNNSGQQSSANAVDASAPNGSSEPQVFALAAITKIDNRYP